MVHLLRGNDKKKQDVEARFDCAFISHIVDARFKFVRGSDGNTTAVVLAQNGETHVFVRPGAPPPASGETSMFPPVVPIDPATLQTYVGEYTSSVGTFYVTRDAGQLSLRLTGQAAFPIFPSAKDTFFLKVVTATVDFQRNAAGVVTGLTLHQGGSTVPATLK